MSRGSVRKRGQAWSIVYDMGHDPATGRRRQRWEGRFPTERAAKRALTKALATSTKVLYRAEWEDSRRVR